MKFDPIPLKMIRLRKSQVYRREIILERLIILQMVDCLQQGMMVLVHLILPLICFPFQDLVQTLLPLIPSI